MLARLRALAAMPWLERRALAAGVVLNPLMLLVLRTRGTKAAVRIVEGASSRRFERVRREATPAVLELASRIGASVNRAAREPAPEVTCLARSLTTRLLLRRRGIDGLLRIGVAPADEDTRNDAANGNGLSFHAWVEVGDVPVNDAPDVAERFATFPLDVGSLSSLDLRSSGSARSSRTRRRRSARE